MFRLLFVVVMIALHFACKKSDPVLTVETSPQDTTQTDTVVDCGCTDYNAYNYSAAFSCNDSSECYYPSDKASGVYFGKFNKAVYYTNGGSEPDQSFHFDTITVSRYSKFMVSLSKNFYGPASSFVFQADKYQDNVTLLHQGIQGTDLEGYVRNDTLYFHQWYTGDWQTTHIIFQGVKI